MEKRKERKKVESKTGNDKLRKKMERNSLRERERDGEREKIGLEN